MALRLPVFEIGVAIEDRRALGFARALLPDDDKAVAAEICTEFLGQRTRKLMERYRVLGTITYKRMNHYLGKAGDTLRRAGVLT